MGYIYMIYFQDYDPWHVAKSVKKGVNKVAKFKGCEEVAAWKKSILNMCYWAASSSNGDEALVRKKWESMLEHVQNKHKNCYHGRLPRGRGVRSKKWLKKGSLAVAKLEEELLKPRLVKDICKMSADATTSNLEAYHSLMLQYAPKCRTYGFLGMQARMRMAAIHYNHNVGRRQAVNKKGELQYTLKYTKYKEDCTVRPIMEATDYGFVDDILRDLFEEAQLKPLCKQANKLKDKAPPSLSSTHPAYNKVPKTELVEQKHTRFPQSAPK